MRCDAPEERVYRLVREYVAAWNGHDVDRLTSLFAENGSYGEFGLGRVMLGREEIRRHLIATFGALPDLTIAPTGEPLTSGERVYWKWLMIATHQSEFAGVPASGKRFEVRGASVLLMKGDKIARGADCFDVGSIVGQVIPECERRLNGGLRAMPDLWMCTLTDEDNIGYGE
jgi:steroid delta-isomerase-like uncharacterized protein